ncbi:hypothetical protein HDU98_006336 [Podochytrium sp. JEL0797]|nr:hypothetical protein HDU98_006336 [Podochytrium sp. JEL0797]
MVCDYGSAPDHVKNGILDGAKLFLRACFEDEGSEGNLADYIVGGSVLIPREIVGDFASWVFPQLQDLLPGMDVREWVEGELLYNMVPEYAQVSDELKDAIRNGVGMFLNAVSEEYGMEASFRVDLGNG